MSFQRDSPLRSGNIEHQRIKNNILNLPALIPGAQSTLLISELIFLFFYDMWGRDLQQIWARRVKKRRVGAQKLMFSQNGNDVGPREKIKSL